MLRTYVLSFAVIQQGSIDDIAATDISQVVLLAPSLAEAQDKLANSLAVEGGGTLEFTDQCRELCENDIFQTEFEGWLTQ